MFLPLQSARTDLRRPVSREIAISEDRMSQQQPQQTVWQRKHVNNRYRFSALPFRNRCRAASPIEPASGEQRQGIIRAGRITRMTAVANAPQLQMISLSFSNEPTGFVTSGANEDAA